MATVQGYQLMVFEWCMIAVTLSFVCLRFYVRMPNRIQRRPSTSTTSTFSKQSFSGASGKPTSTNGGSLMATCSKWRCPWPISDIFVLFAWISFTGQAIMDTILYADGFFQPGIDPWNPVMSDYKAQRALKIYFAENVTYLNCMFAVKFAMLCLYHEFFPKEMKKTRICLWITDAFTVISFFTGSLMILFYCLPINRNWTRDPAEFCSSLNYTPVMVVAIGTHVLTDIMIYILPMVVIKNLHHTLPRWQRIGLVLTFGAGFLCVFFAVGLLIGAYETQSFATYYLFCVFEQTWAVIVACLPSIKFIVSSNRWRWIRRARDEVECSHGYRATHMDLLYQTVSGQQRGGAPGKRANSLALGASTLSATTDKEPIEPHSAILTEPERIFPHNPRVGQEIGGLGGVEQKTSFTETREGSIPSHYRREDRRRSTIIMV